MDVIEAYIYFYHLDKEFHIPVLPESIQNTASISFSQEAILGRSAPQVTFSSAGPRTQNVSLNFHRQIMDLENENIVKEILATARRDDKGNLLESDDVLGQRASVAKNAIDTTDMLINALAAATLPKYLDTYKAIIPPSVRCRFGNESSIAGVLTDGIQQTSSGAWLNNGKMSMIQISFTILEVKPYSADYALENGFLRGVSKDLARSSVWKY